MTKPASRRRVWWSVGALLLVVAVVAGLSHVLPDGGDPSVGGDAARVDCDEFRAAADAVREGEPGSTARLPAGVRFWRAVEVCNATGDTLCHQSYAALRAVPSMAVSDGGVDMDEYQSTYLPACERLPREVQRCLLVSYFMEHREECARLDAKKRLDTALRE